MKTKILEWDLNIQAAILVANIVMLVCIHSLQALLGAQLLISIYLLATDALNLKLEHRSLGFAWLRKLYLSAESLYVLLALFALTISFGIMNGLVMFLLIALLQIIFISHYLLCRHELYFLRKREFFILK